MSASSCVVSKVSAARDDAKDVRCQAVEGEGHDGPDGDDEGEGMESVKDGTCHGREEEEEAEEDDDDEEEDPEDEREDRGQTLER